MPLVILLVPIHAILLVVGYVLVSPTDSPKTLGIGMTSPLGLAWRVGRWRTSTTLTFLDDDIPTIQSGHI
jgi:hypothetical protein